MIISNLLTSIEYKLNIEVYMHYWTKTYDTCCEILKLILSY